MFMENHLKKGPYPWLIPSLFAINLALAFWSFSLDEISLRNEIGVFIAPFVEKIKSSVKSQSVFLPQVDKYRITTEYDLIKAKYALLNRNTTPIPTMTPTPEPSVAETLWVLIDKTSKENREIFSFSPEEGDIIQWKNLIIYGAGSSESNPAKITSLNLTTGEKKVIYDEASDIKNRDDKQTHYVSDLKIINDTLYFSLGGYAISGYTFWVDLPSVSSTHKLAETQYGGSIRQLGAHYFLVTGVGDGCSGIEFFSLIDVNTKKINHVTKIQSNCDEFEQLIGIDKQERLLFSRSVFTENSNQGKYTKKSVYGINIFNPSQNDEVIPEEKMPEGITSIYSLADKNQLLLVGAVNYIFNIDKNELQKTDISPPQDTMRLFPYKPLNEKIKEITLPQGYEFIQK